MGTSKFRDVVTAPAAWMTFSPFSVGVTSTTCLANLSWDILATWLN